jgi:hypothetical protein
MTYNPTVNDQSGQITAGYQTRSAEITAAGNEALASGIMQGATSAIGGGLGAATGFNTAGMIKDASGNSIPGLGDALNSVKANAVKYETASGMMDSYKQNADALGLDMQMLQGIEQKYANKPNELIGALTVVGKIGENNMELNKSKQIADIYGANNKDLAMWKAGNTGAAVADPKYDANRARESYELIRNRGYNHDQAIEAMNASGMNWAVQYITPPARGLSIMDQVLPPPTSPPPTR